MLRTITTPNCSKTRQHTPSGCSSMEDRSGIRTSESEEEVGAHISGIRDRSQDDSAHRRSACHLRIFGKSVGRGVRKHNHVRFNMCILRCAYALADTANRQPETMLDILSTTCQKLQNIPHSGHNGDLTHATRPIISVTVYCSAHTQPPECT